MAAKEDVLGLISPEDVTSIDTEKIDDLIGRIIQESGQNYEEIGEMALECSAALSSAQTRSSAMASRGFFRRGWDKVTGKDDQLRNAIDRDNAAAQYAMQQMVKGVLNECVQNQKLLLVVKRKFENELQRLEENQNSLGADVVAIRKALVAVYNKYVEKTTELETEQRHIRQHMGARCGYCREELDQKQVVCPYCGTLQKLKLEKLPMRKQTEMRELSRLMKASPNEWNMDIEWDDIAEKYAQTIKRTQEIARNAGVLSAGAKLNQDIADLINKCRSAEFQIAVVGVIKAGKSMLLNALIGLELAPVGLNSKTAALTKFRSSNKGNYVHVRFYSKAEWDNLKDSASRSRKELSAEGESSLEKRLSEKTVLDAAKKWIGHEDITETYSDLMGFQEGIKRWTAADSDDHLFAAEVEVGIDKKLFNMPEEVVFVDTPGLHDPVKYRSKITEDYIGNANAVLVAVKPDALGEEAYKTVTTVLDYAGSNRKKVYIIGTQQDKLATKDDYEQLIDGEDGWIQRLTESGHYKDRRAASAQIFTVSAKLHLYMNKALRLSAEELECEEKFSTTEYNDLERGVKIALGLKRYALENLLNDPQDVAAITDYFGVEKLKKALENGLISQYRKLKVDDIASDYAMCKRALVNRMVTEINERREKLEAAQNGADAVAAKAADAKREKEALEKKKSQIERTLARLREFTEGRISTLNL